MNDIELYTDDVLNFVNYELDVIGIERNVQNVCGFFFALHREAIEKNMKSEIFDNVDYIYSRYSESMFEGYDFSNMYMFIDGKSKRIVFEEKDIIRLSEEKFEFFRQLMKGWIEDQFSPEEYSEYFKETFEIFLHKYNKLKEIDSVSSNIEWVKFSNNTIRNIIVESEFVPEVIRIERNEVNIPDFIEDVFINKYILSGGIVITIIATFLIYMFLPLIYLLLYYSVTLAAIVPMLLLRVKSKDGISKKHTLAIFTGLYSLVLISILGKFGFVSLVIVLTTYLSFNGILTKGFSKNKLFN